MPREPTMRVIGSQFISTRPSVLGSTVLTGFAVAAILLLSCSVSSWAVAGGESRPRMPPLRFFVGRMISDAAQRPDHPAVEADGARRERRARRFIHKRHEFVREARHGAGDADAADVRAAADAAHPGALGHVAIHDRP